MSGKNQNIVHDREEKSWRKAGLWLAIVLIVIAATKVCTTSLFDLGAISNITGEQSDDLAVASGMGKICLVGALLMFSAAAYGFNLYRGDRKTIRKAIVFSSIAIASGIITGIIAITDGHNTLDAASSWIGSVVSISLTICAMKIIQ